MKIKEIVNNVYFDFGGYVNTYFDPDSDIDSILYDELREGYLNVDSVESIDISEIFDINMYMQDMSNEIIDIVNTYFSSENIPLTLEYVNTYSPKYYNFDTDNIVVNIEFCKDYFNKLIQNDDFKQYVNTNYSSSEGFISFIDVNTYNWTFQDNQLSIILDYLLQDNLLETLCIDNINMHSVILDNLDLSKYKIKENK